MLDLVNPVGAGLGLASRGQALTQTLEQHSGNVGAAALLGVFLVTLTSDAPGCDHSARVSQSTNRNQDTGNQGQHYAQDHEVSQRELRAPFRLFGIIAPGLATS